MINQSQFSQTPVLNKYQTVILALISISFSICFLKDLLFDKIMLILLYMGITLSAFLILFSQIISEKNTIFNNFKILLITYLYPFCGTCFILNQQQEYLMYVFFLIGFFVFLDFIDHKLKEVYNLAAIILALMLTKYIYQDLTLSLQVKNFYTCAITFLLTSSYHHYDQKRESRKQIRNLKILGGSIAHELRTPLATLMMSAEIIKDTLPKMIKIFKKNKEMLVVDSEKLNLQQINNLEILPDVLEKTAREASLFVDMLLEKIKIDNGKVSYFEICNSKVIIEESIRNYPFNENISSLIQFSTEKEFLFKSNHEAMKHVMFNLIRNALYQIKKHGRGYIEIWCEEEDHWNAIHFKDTAIGVKESELLKIFNTQFESSSGGTGLGLSFCQLVIEGSQGNIICQSMFGEYIEFILRFPKLRN